jgi:16S rRNA processing protein RimM
MPICWGCLSSRWKAIDDFGAGDVIEVERPDKKRFMVPMNADAVPEWNAERLVVDTAFVV